MGIRPGTGLKRWQLAVDIVIYIASAGIFTVLIAGLGDCATAPSAAEVAECQTFVRTKFDVCVVIAALIFPFWLRRKLMRTNGS